MVNQVTSRSQRRVEKKQALVMLALILAVSLVSFALGVVVGKSGSDEQVAQVEFNPPPKAVVEPESPLPVRQPVLPSATTTETEPQAEQLPVETLAEEASYDNLPKVDQAPLGSGINRPPYEEAPPVEESPEVVTTQPQAPVAATVVRPAASVRPTAPAAASASGQLIVQAASFKESADANKLRVKLASKGYPAFVESADLGDRGIWHRVMLGPYSDRGAAEATLAQLQTVEKLSGIVKKR